MAHHLSVPGAFAYIRLGPKLPDEAPTPTPASNVPVESSSDERKFNNASDASDEVKSEEKKTEVRGTLRSGALAFTDPRFDWVMMMIVHPRPLVEHAGG